MARLVKRFFGKKRGTRNTRSDTIGGAWWAVFSALFLVAGCVVLFQLLSQVMIPEWRANNHFRETEGKVLDKRLQEKETEEGDHVYRPQLLVGYDVSGEHYERWTFDAAQMFTSNRPRAQATIDSFTIGETRPCWYDPLNPSEVVLARGYSWHAWLFLISPVPLIGIGSAGLLYAWIHWGRSTEHRALRSAQAARLPLIDEPGQLNRFPCVPSHQSYTDSAGTTLSYRLPSEPAAWSVLGLSMTTLVFLGTTLVFITMSVNGFRSGQPDWFITLLSALCLAGTVALAITTLRRCLISTGVGLTLIEINQHPLYPGEEFELFVSQPGSMTLNRLRLLLTCDEEARYQQGTHLNIAGQRVFESELLSREGLTIQPGTPFEARLKLPIPASAMHSFECDHNKIQWRIVVDGDVANHPAFQRAFPLIVHPRPERSGV